MASVHIWSGGTGPRRFLRVEGRATFACSQEVRRMGMSAIDDAAREIYLDLNGCVGMDSSFMGVLAMIALRLGEVGGRLRLGRASPAAIQLLDGLGLTTLMPLAEEPVDWPSAWTEMAIPPTENMDSLRVSLLEAHRTLGLVDPANVPRFQTVVSMLEKEDAK